MGARLLDPSDLASSSGPTSSEQTARAAAGQGSGLGRAGWGSAGGEGWGRGANGLRTGPGAAGWAPRGPRIATLESSVRSTRLPVGRFLVGLGLRGEDWLVPRPPAFPFPSSEAPCPGRVGAEASERSPRQAGGGGASGPVRGRGGAAERRPPCGLSAEDPAGGSPLPFFLRGSFHPGGVETT